MIPSYEEMELLREHCEQLGVGFAINNAFSEGGEGAVDMARLIDYRTF